MPRVMLQVTLLQSGQTILTTFTGNLQNRALETFRKTGVNVRLGVRVTEITESEVPCPFLVTRLLHWWRQNLSHGMPGSTQHSLAQHPCKLGNMHRAAQHFCRCIPCQRCL